MRLLFAALAVSFATLSAAQASGWHTWRDTHAGYSISYPDDWRVDSAHVYTALGAGKEIRGTAFYIPAALTTGTNLSDDSYLAVEVLPGIARCTPEAFLNDAIDTARAITDKSGMKWLVQDGADMGAGNIYEETVQAAIGTQPCLATRAFVHSANISNFDPGTVRPFDRARLNGIIDKMRHSFRISPP